MHARCWKEQNSKNASGRCKSGSLSAARLFYLHGLRSACCQLFTRVFWFPISHTTKLNWNEYIRPGGPSLVWTNRLMFHYSVNLELCIIHGWLGHIRLQWAHHLVHRMGKIQNKMRPHRLGSGVIGPQTTDISTWDLRKFLVGIFIFVKTHHFSVVQRKSKWPPIDSY